jgi:ureidoacrylate peracid hydrolase
MLEPTREVFVDNGMIRIRPCFAALQPPGAGSSLALAPEKTAVVIVDVQRYFTETPPFSAMQQIVPRIAGVLQAARAAGMTVAHVKSEFLANMADAGRPGSRTRQMMDSLCGVGGTENPLAQANPLAEIAPELAPELSDVVVTKTRFSGFWRTNLDELLKARNIESLIFTGGTTTVCLESTLRDALFCEYNALVLSDCAMDMTPELHESALTRIEMFFGWICRSEELISALREIGQRGKGSENSPNLIDRQSQ